MITATCFSCIPANNPIDAGNSALHRTCLALLLTAGEDMGSSIASQWVDNGIVNPKHKSVRPTPVKTARGSAPHENRTDQMISQTSRQAVRLLLTNRLPRATAFMPGNRSAAASDLTR